MLYDFILTNGDDRGSILPIRRYSANSLNEKQIQNVNTMLFQALKATGLAVGDMSNTVLSFEPAWVQESAHDETLMMLLADSVLIESEGKIESHGAKSIALQILNDFASTEDWAFLFDGKPDSFSILDFEQFSFIDDRRDNTNLKVAIGEKVYLRFHGTQIFTYLGRPTNNDINYKYIQQNNGVETYAIDSEIIAVDGFNIKNYVDGIETFPLPQSAKRAFGKNRYFSRAKSKKSGSKTFIEGFGKTKKESQIAVALELAFQALDNS